MNAIRAMYRGENSFDFLGKSKRVFLLSGILILISLVSFTVRGLNLGIEFEGGVVWDVPAQKVDEATIRDTLAQFGLADARVQKVSGGFDTWRVRAEITDFDREVQITEALAQAAEVSPNDINRSEVGPSWGNTVTSKAERALVYFFVVLALYITLRFEWKMAVAALAAVVHDIVISVGVYSLFQFEITPATVIAFLTIMGYSLYDTIVVFDRVKENTTAALKGRTTYSDVVNVSMNQVVMRSINTSITSLLPVLSMLIIGSWLMGAVALREFALALFVGIVVGTYSSIFIATPIQAMLKEREPAWAQRTVHARRAGDVGIAAAADALAASNYSRRAAPRPRKKKPRKRR